MVNAVDDRGEADGAGGKLGDVRELPAALEALLADPQEDLAALLQDHADRLSTTGTSNRRRCRTGPRGPGASSRRGPGGGHDLGDLRARHPGREGQPDRDGGLEEGAGVLACPGRGRLDAL